MLDSVLLLPTAWANLRVGLANAVLITAERRAETRPQLSKGSSGFPRQLVFLLVFLGTIYIFSIYRLEGFLYNSF